MNVIIREWNFNFQRRWKSKSWSSSVLRSLCNNEGMYKCSLMNRRSGLHHSSRGSSYSRSSSSTKQPQFIRKNRTAAHLPIRREAVCFTALSFSSISIENGTTPGAYFANFQKWMRRLRCYSSLLTNIVSTCLFRPANFPTSFRKPAKSHLFPPAFQPTNVLK